MQIGHGKSRGVFEGVVSGLRPLEDDGARVSRNWPSLIAALYTLGRVQNESYWRFDEQWGLVHVS